MSVAYTFIILTLNEELHLPRLLNIISQLKARVCILDSGSTDQTRDIAQMYHADFRHHTFENHPKQWGAALQAFSIQTPWVICLDADQYPSPALIRKLQQFQDTDYPDIDGIYFNRKHYFRDKWIRYGGCYPQYQLKMFRYSLGWSDLNEVLDHRFQVKGKTVRWKHAPLLERNEKENNIGFWIIKHNHYADLLAEAALSDPGCDLKSKSHIVVRAITGHANQRNAFRQQLWNGLPLYFRPFLYFCYRFFIRLGFLDGKQGMIFHFLHAFWFRLLTDIKIDEKQKQVRRYDPGKPNSTIIFPLRFLFWFSVLYTSNIVFISLSTSGGRYSDFIGTHLNYITEWRNFTVCGTSILLKQLGYSVHTRTNGLTVTGHSGFNIVYSCLGYGVMSNFAAFVISYPKPRKLPFLLFGLCFIQCCNMLRLVLISLHYPAGRRYLVFHLDHHDIYNSIIYLLLAALIYIWTRF